MRRFREVIESNNPINTDSLYVSKDGIKAFIEGEWITVNGGSSDSNKILKLDITDDQFTKILNGESIILNKEGINSDSNVIQLKVGNYSYFLGRIIQTNGTSSYSTHTIVNNTVNTLEVVVSKGVATISSKLVSLTEYVYLKIGDSADIKSYNKQRLKDGFFLVQLDYGYGVGTYQPANGGFAHVTTAYGDDVFYKIGTDGGIIKDSEYLKPDTYTVVIDNSLVNPEGTDVVGGEGVKLDDITASLMRNCINLVLIKPSSPSMERIIAVYRRGHTSPLRFNYYYIYSGTLYEIVYDIPSKSLVRKSPITLLEKVPLANTSKIGGIKIGFTQTGKKYPLNLENEKAFVEVPWVSYSAFKGSTSSAAGSTGLVPAPAANMQGRFLRGDGTWQVPTNTTYNPATTTANGLMTKEDKAKLDGIAAQANKYTLPAANKTTIGGVKAGTNIADLATNADLATVIGTVNSLLAQLRTAGILIS